jgi:ABC-type thiamine transport system substrate-binding protein
MTQQDVSKKNSMFPAVDKSNIPARPSLRIALLAIIGHA